MIDPAPRWWKCDTHGPAKANAWGCPECVREMRGEIAELRRWKSTHAPRIETLEGLLRHEQLEAHAGREAIATLASERAANAVLTDELDQARAVIEQARAALAEELAAWELDPPLHHVKTAHDACVSLLDRPAVATKEQTT